jgi:hypothetical protein
VEPELLARLGLRHVHLPVIDGRLPDAAVVDRFLSLVAAEDGLVYLHCSAGVGRTGTLAAAHLLRHGVGPVEALRRNLEVGPPSIEQVAFVLGASGGRPARPPLAVSLLSRLVDGPRRAYTVVRHRSGAGRRQERPR